MYLEPMQCHDTWVLEPIPGPVHRLKCVHEQVTYNLPFVNLFRSVVFRTNEAKYPNTGTKF